MGRRLAVVMVVAASLLGAAPRAFAGGGNYSFDGGNAFERQQVEAALGASTFDWSLVPGPVAIHIARGIGDSHSTPGNIYLDADLLDTGTFAWGVVQMEYGQQVQFSLMTAAMKQQLTTDLSGAQQWCYEDPTLSRGANACERFAATLAWAYWESPKNCMEPSGAGDWSASMEPGAFRALLGRWLGVQPVTVAPLRTTQSELPLLRRSDGSLRLPVSVPGAGSVTVAGYGVRPASVVARSAATVGLWLRPLRAAARFVTVVITYTPVGGTPISTRQTLRLGRRA